MKLNLGMAKLGQKDVVGLGALVRNDKGFVMPAKCA